MWGKGILGRGADLVFSRMLKLKKGVNALKFVNLIEKKICNMISDTYEIIDIYTFCWVWAVGR